MAGENSCLKKKKYEVCHYNQLNSKTGQVWEHCARWLEPVHLDCPANGAIQSREVEVLTVDFGIHININTDNTSEDRDSNICKTPLRNIKNNSGKLWVLIKI